MTAACSVAGCRRRLFSRGYCGAHWKRWKRGQDLDVPIGGMPHPRARLTADVVAEMRRRHAEGESMCAIGRACGVARATARQAILGHTWKGASQ